jgi:uncharacterized protein (DUF362 family)
MKLSRRQLLLASSALGAPLACGGTPSRETVGRESAAPQLGEAGALPDADAAAPADATDAGGRFVATGLVVEVANAASVVGDKIDAGAVRKIMTRGMQELTGEAREEDAWKTVFSPSDVVAIKVNPFGYPKFYSRPETVSEIIRGLNMAGVSNGNIIIYDRYTDYLAQVGYESQLPPGVRFASAVLTTAAQTDIQGTYTNEYVEFAKVDTGLDPTVAGNRRSYLCDVVSNQATKVINVPVLKSHWTAGVTAALKNITYGLVNNTARTHADTNWTIDFLPAVASMKKLRQKLVLNIVDLLVGCYDGGPDPSNSTFNYASLLFSTDAVAVDRICWKIIDDKRASVGLGPVASMANAEPQYILRCGDAGLGVSDLASIDHRMFTL